VYSSISGLSSQLVRSTVRRALDEYLGALVDPLPAERARRLGLPTLAEAMRYVHFPPDEACIEALNQFDTPHHKRLVFDRFFLVMLIMAFRKKSRQRASGAAFSIPSRLMADLGKFFPFELTSHQIRALEEIVEDLGSDKPMNRLLLGDVGCGKTAVAVLAAHISIQNGRQVAIMAPTQILANQHLEYFRALKDRMEFRPVLMTGAMKKAERDEVYRRIRDGSYNLVIGTQSLIQAELFFSNLGLTIIDEQHRFGVRDRALIDRKGNNPHQLVMTATPIPRTMAMTVYGDMDISLITEYPAGRMPVVTLAVPPEEKREVFEALKDRLAKGEQAFVICPVIEGSEDLDLKDATEMAERLKKILSPPYQVGLVHGRLSPEKREAIMAQFRKGLLHILVATTVIEVGIHVPTATLMIIEHPERFGLSQLHQLRGRVGRGAERGICYLMLPHALSERTASRLRILVENQDGFEIARKDLELRGQGEFIGMRQAGVGDLDITELMREPELVSRAKEEAEYIIESDPDLERPENRLLKAFVDSVLSRPLDL
ncbi:MAG: ATP-dependent DNA helicase RecG, partial [Proteobacteria bacterium]|nr:ATP-dependent DNA helicase RecG [Pseudomonadota bacterium]